ncbi:hypothetical protein [Paraburkholderia phenoliruptrix]|uniref:hypothetical protein n=1 Tax=Paraburkholderia phenoliruptrix TaxID=252970 RepID=UPI003D974772
MTKIKAFRIFEQPKSPLGVKSGVKKSASVLAKCFPKAPECALDGCFECLVAAMKIQAQTGQKCRIARNDVCDMRNTGDARGEKDYSLNQQ